MPGSSSRARPGQTLSALVAMLAVAVVAGVLVAVAVTPAIALTGGSASSGIGLFSEVPTDLAIAPLDQKTEIYAKDGTRDVAIASFYAQDREVVGWKQISSAVKNAAVAGEDVRFYQHGGVDPLGIVRATVANLAGQDLQGASTITQQYVKNVCVQEAENLATPRAVGKAYAVCTDASVGRKLREARLAIALEKRYSKQDILLGYLNIAGFGGRVYGVQSAAEYYFGTSAARLSIAQSASLMAIVNNPQALRLDDSANLARNRERRDYILGVELRNRLISQAQYDTAVATAVTPRITPTVSGCRTAGPAGYFCDYVVRTILSDKAFGATPAIRNANLQRAGWKIHTTLDLAVERRAKEAMAAYVPGKSDELDLGGAAVSVQVGTGRVVSMVQNTEYDPAAKNASGGATSVNYSADKQLGASNGFQPGSTFKVFTLLQWLKSGHTLTESVDSSPGTKAASSFTACGKQYKGRDWTFGNDDADEGGSQTVLNATARSINGAFASMAQQLDLCDIQQTAEDFGVFPANGDKDPTLYLPFVIGGSYGVAPVAMAAAYAGIANDGKYCSPIAIDRVQRPDGSELTVPGSTCKQVVDPQVAIAAAYALRGVFQGGTAGGDNTADGVYEFGKTGTTDGAVQTWLVGTTSKITTAVWVGNVSGHQSLRQVSLNECSATGGSLASNARHCVWKDIQTAANAIYGGATSWAQPESQYLDGSTSTPSASPAAGTVPDVAGMTKDAAAQALVAAGFAWAYGDDVPSDQPSGAVASTDPAAGAQAAPHTQIVIHGSTGSTG